MTHPITPIETVSDIVRRSELLEAAKASKDRTAKAIADKVRAAKARVQADQEFIENAEIALNEIESEALSLQERMDDLRFNAGPEASAVRALRVVTEVMETASA